MTLKEAIEGSFNPEVYEGIKKHLSPPELLQAAAIECFLKEPTSERARLIREELTLLRLTGITKRV